MALNPNLMASSLGGHSVGITLKNSHGKRRSLVISIQQKQPIVWVATKNMPDMQVLLLIMPDSFREMYEANNTSFKPADGELPNTMLRFDLESVKSKSTVFSNNSEFNVLGGAIVFTFFVAAFYLYNQSQEEAKEETKLSKTSEKLNQSKSQLLVGLGTTSTKKEDLEKSRKKAEQNILLAFEAEAQEDKAHSRSRPGKSSKVFSDQEQRLRKLTPDLSAIDPDQD